jgi:GNAT superfamily N-acetyltransferase
MMSVFYFGEVIMVEIITASEKDIPIIEDILMDTVRWLDSIGQPLWREDQITWARLSKDFSASDFFIALLDGVPAACMAVVDYDPVFWPDIKKGSSLFIHKLAVKRFAAGKGLSDTLIAYAKKMCIEQGIAALRLDCHSLIPKQRAVYERNGFICVDEKKLYEKYHTAFYKCEVNTSKRTFEATRF